MLSSCWYSHGRPWLSYHNRPHYRDLLGDGYDGTVMIKWCILTPTAVIYKFQPRAVIYLLTRPLCDTESILKCRLHVIFMLIRTRTAMTVNCVTIKVVPDSRADICWKINLFLNLQRLANSTPKLDTVLYECCPVLWRVVSHVVSDFGRGRLWQRNVRHVLKLKYLYSNSCKN